MPSKESILKGYATAGKQARQNRELLFLTQKQSGIIPSDKNYTDENYYEYIGKNFAPIPPQPPAPNNVNEYLTNITNKLAETDFRAIVGNRDDLFMRGYQKKIQAGNAIEILYTTFGETLPYDPNKFVPDEFTGGEYVLSQWVQLSSEKFATNKDKKKVTKVVPTLIITQALLPSITSGLANGWPSIFDMQITKEWEKFRFERFRETVARAGGAPQGDKRNEWFNSETTWKKNDAQFVKITKPIKSAEDFQSFLTQVYTMSAIWYGSYQDQYNPAGIPQIWPLSEQSLFLDSSLDPYWRSTNAIIYNSELIDIKQTYKSIEWFKILPSEIDPAITTIKAILYADGTQADGRSTYPFMHWTFTDYPAYRAVQNWAQNATTEITDHFWLTSAVNMSVNIVIFYE